MEEITIEVFLKKKKERKEIIEHIFTEIIQKKKKKKKRILSKLLQKSYAK